MEGSFFPSLPYVSRYVRACVRIFLLLSPPQLQVMDSSKDAFVEWEEGERREGGGAASG